jgi:DNA-binding CsgD family transcriptional regulator
VRATSLNLDARGLSRLIGLGYEAALVPDGWRAFTHDAALACHAALATFEYRDQRHPEGSFAVSGGLGPEFEQLFATSRTNVENDRFYLGMRNKPAGTVRLGDEIVPPEVSRRMDTWTRFATPWDLEHFVIGVIDSGDGGAAIISLARTSRDAPFVPGDKDVLRQMLLGHLRRSIRLHRQLEAAHETGAILSSAIDESSEAMVIFGSHGEVLMINRHAAAMLADSDLVSLRGGRLAVADTAIQAELDAALGGALGISRGVVAPPPAPILVTGRPGECGAQVTYTPLRPRSVQGGLAPGAAVVAVLREERRHPRRAIPAGLRTTFRLTRAEVRLCEALVEGSSLPECAARLDISRNTAKTHLARIFDKTGVRSQVALLRLLAMGGRAGGQKY